MFHPALEPQGPRMLDRLETLDVNREILAATHRLAFDQPHRRLIERIPVPEAPPKTLLPEGPIPWESPERGDLYRWVKRTRWATSPNPPPWPVPRWWVLPQEAGQWSGLPPVGVTE